VTPLPALLYGLSSVSPPGPSIQYPPPPLAPVGMTVSAPGAGVALVSLSVVGVIGLVWALADAVRRRSPMFLAVFLGGVATSLLEPFADLLGLVWFPVNQVQAFTMLGIPIPLFVVIGYSNLFGILPWIFLRTFASRPDRRRYWQVAAAMMLAACVFEWLLLRTGAYTYYGNQPLNVWGYPLIWMTVNTGACVLAAAVLHRLPVLFRGAGVWAAVAVVPCADGAVMLGTGWPAFAAIHSELGSVAVQLLGLLAIGLGLALFAVIGELCCTDGRLRAAPPGSAGVPAPRAGLTEEARA
jgi:hypothetical protein